MDENTRNSPEGIVHVPDWLTINSTQCEMEAVGQSLAACPNPSCYALVMLRSVPGGGERTATINCFLEGE